MILRLVIRGLKREHVSNQESIEVCATEETSFAAKFSGFLPELVCSSEWPARWFVMIMALDACAWPKLASRSWLEERAKIEMRAFRTRCSVRP